MQNIEPQSLTLYKISLKIDHISKCKTWHYKEKNSENLCDLGIGKELLGYNTRIVIQKRKN